MDDLALAERLVRTASGIARDMPRGLVETKATASDVVTQADRAAEAALVDLLRAERPHDGIVGEEGAAVAGERRWLLDPIDGTLNYAAGVPVWCAAVALVDEAGPLVSAVHDPVHDELFSAARGAGARCNGRLLQVSSAPSLADATVATFVDARRRDAAIRAGTDALTRTVGAMRAVGSGTLELAWLAAGRLHAWTQPDAEPWDWHPGALLVAEAGGTARVRGRWYLAAATEPLARELEELVE